MTNANTNKTTYQVAQELYRKAKGTQRVKHSDGLNTWTVNQTR